MNPPPLTGYLTIAQASALTGLSQSQITHLCRAGTVNASKIAPRLWLVEVASLEEYLKSNPKPGPKPKSMRKPKAK